MKDTTNFNVIEHKYGRSIEKIINDNCSELLTWHNKEYNGMDQYDCINNNKGDFSLTNTNVKIEVQAVKQWYASVYIPKRRYYDYVTKNDKVIYTNEKDVTNTLLLFSDGNKYAWAWADGLDRQFLGEIMADRRNGEETFSSSLRNFKQGSISTLKIWLMLEFSSRKR